MISAVVWARRGVPAAVPGTQDPVTQDTAGSRYAFRCCLPLVLLPTCSLGLTVPAVLSQQRGTRGGGGA
jgi:hypothetical protein